jgi:hypothetical protein
MLGWTLGGYPSPNLEIVPQVLQKNSTTMAEEAMRAVAERRFGKHANVVLEAWKGFSTAFSEFPYHIGVVYSGPQQLGSANLLLEKASGYRASMVGFPYDDLNGWRAIYPPETFAAQFEKVADGFAHSSALLTRALQPDLSSAADEALSRELRIALAAGIHFRSVANQARFVMAREALRKAATAADAAAPLADLERLVHAELKLAQDLHRLQRIDSRIGFEATNQYYYVPADLAEKVLNCLDLLERWLPEQRERWKNAAP